MEPQQAEPQHSEAETRLERRVGTEHVPTDDPLVYIVITEFLEPTLLILGDPESFQWLAGLIESRWTGKLSALTLRVRFVNIADLEITYPGADGGVERQGSLVHWRIHDEGVHLFPAQLRTLGSSGPGHHYLDAPPGVATIEVVASTGEYDPTVFFG